MKKLHFHSFDAFRFFAFLKVFLLHAPLVMAASNPEWISWAKEYITYGGGIGVSFFFVLSGFLITYILTFDKIHQGNISPKRFFIRRAFRIWPLFYLMVIIAMIIPPDFAEHIGFYMNGGGYEPDWRYSFTFTENIHMIMQDNVPKTTPLSVFWSLCIEEQFYILWMIVFFFVKRRWIPVFLITSILFAIGWRVAEPYIYQNDRVTWHGLFSNLDYFAVSGLLGFYVATSYEKVAAFVSKIPLWVRWSYVIGVVLMIIFLAKIFEHDIYILKVLYYTITALVFTGLLLVFVPQDSKIRFSDKNVFTKLGKISYGLYVYHIIWIHVVYKFYRDYSIEVDNIRNYLLFLMITFSLTVVTSYLSYKFFEMPILRVRDKLFPNKKS
jgi:peptidoglycan/LPS O-acetylase OafA/YrhL